MSDPAAFFEAIARRYDRAYALDADATRTRMRRVLAELPARSRVLDLGVGTGRELSALQDAGHTPVGLELSASMIAICARRARPVPLVQADLWKPLPFPDASFDACIALHGTLAHPPPSDGNARDGAHEALATEVARVVRPGGAFVAEVPAPALLEQLARGPVTVGDLTLRRIADDRVRHEDRAAGVDVEAVILSPDRWLSVLAPCFDAVVEPLVPWELLVVAHRR